MLSTGELQGRIERRKRDTNLTELLARANHLMGDSFYEGMKGHGLSAADWRVLGALSEHDGLKMAQLADLVLFKQPTLTKVVDRLERAQLVERCASSIDRRCTIARLTNRGRRVAAPLMLRLREHEAALHRTLGVTVSREIKAALAALLDRLSRLPQENRMARDGRPTVV